MFSRNQVACERGRVLSNPQYLLGKTVERAVASVLYDISRGNEDVDFGYELGRCRIVD